ncbi:MAG: hypothetical protein V2A74_10450, partial [bacterium]
MRKLLGEGQCRVCHATLADERLSSPVRWLEYDRHARAGMGCADCHGGDPTANEIVGAHDLKKGFVGVPSPEEITEICGHCHRDAEFMRTQN